MTERVTEMQDVYDLIIATCQEDPEFKAWGASALRYLNRLTRPESESVTVMREALEKCRDKFREYVDLHHAKLADTNSPKALDAIMDKVNRNRDMADLCDEALTRIGCSE